MVILVQYCTQPGNNSMHEFRLLQRKALMRFLIRLQYVVCFLVQ